MNVFNSRSDETHYAINPNTEKRLTDQFLKHLTPIKLKKPHVWIATSGTLGCTRKSKWVALSKDAILHSAESVNRHIRATKKDIWINALPDYHIGGISIWARGYLSGSKVINFKKVSEKWSPSSYFDCLNQEKGTLSALVPTQLYDLVNLNIYPPKSLRALLIGGGSIVDNLIIKAKKMGWPILPTYGLTECASQVATAPINSIASKKVTNLKILDHVNVTLNEKGCFKLQSRSLLSLYALIEDDKVSTFDPKVKGIFQTNDKGTINEKTLIPMGRSDSFIKIVGENVNLNLLQKHSDEICYKLNCDKKIVICDLPDARRGRKIVLVHNGVEKEMLDAFLTHFNSLVAPYEKINEIFFKKEIPITELGKIRIDLLRNYLFTFPEKT